MRSDKWRPRVGISGLLLTFALMPVLGASWFAYQEYREVTQSAALATEVQADTDQLVHLTNLRSALLDERNWISAQAGVEEIGVPIEAVELLTGIPLRTELEESVAAVDDLLATSAYADVKPELDRLRTPNSGTIDEIATAYNVIEFEIADESAAVLDHLLDVSGDVHDGADLLRSLRMLETAVQMRQSITYQLTYYFSAQFSGLTSASVDAENLISQIALYEDAFSELDRTLEPNEPMAQELAAIVASADAATMRTAVDLLVNEAFTGNLNETGMVSDASIPDFAVVAATFDSGTRHSDDHLALVNSAGLIASDASRDVSEAATKATSAAIRSIGVIALLSLLFTGLLAQFIVRPLRKLARTAKALRDGETDLRTKPFGPREVQSATAALNEAAAHLQLAERQASALAEGNLGHDVLNETAPGALGESLQSAVHTLTSSLSEREDFRRRLAHETSHDALTGLPNRNSCLAQLQQSLARSVRNESSVAVLYVDLDEFNQINDLHGHPAGDRVLRAISRRLVSNVREGDQVGRLGGDEFLVIAEPVSGPAEAMDLGNRLREAVAEAMRVDGADLHIEATIGIAITDSGVLTADEMLRDADLAVHKAKSTNSGDVQLCDESLRAEILQRADLEQALRRAIDRDELTLFYQPIVRSADAVTTGFEALVRWDRPGQGLAYPGDFIPVAERSDLIVELDRWVLNRVAKQLKEWSSSTDFADVSISVNVSGRHLGSSEFFANVAEPLSRNDVDPGRLIVEVTESALLEDLGEAAGKLQELRDRGVRIAIDDFGTGYTSLAHLKTLPIDILKIDRSFTNDTNAMSLVQLIIDTGHLLGASITAEGIETLEQQQTLTELGSDNLQGYFFARPAPPSKLASPTVNKVAQLN